MRTTVIHHSADWDGLFCREIARKFLPKDTEFVGWDFADKTLQIPEGQIYVLDLPVDRVFGFEWKAGPKGREIHFHKGCDPNFFNTGNPLQFLSRVIWIDHHKSSLDTHPKDIPGYRLDGVAAARLCWQWFTRPHHEAKCGECLPTKAQFIARAVDEPLAVRLVGEYDVWNHRGDGDVEFQFGLDAQGDRQDFSILLSSDGNKYVGEILHCGYAAMNCYAKRDADVMRTRSFLVDFEGLKFLALNTARCNSNTFAACDVPETGHDALMALCFDGKVWRVSLYHAAHRRDLDLSLIAVRHGGGGHKGACGFISKTLPFVP